MNTIIWGNQAVSGTQIYNDNSSPRIAYSDIQGSGGSAVWDTALGTDSGGNIDADPQFIDPDGIDNLELTADDNFRVDPVSSPAIDSGITSGALGNCTQTDLDDVARPFDGDLDGVSACDMGAYEWHPVLYAAPASRGTADCSSWGNACLLQTALATAVVEEEKEEIWVEMGAHYPTTSTTDITTSFALRDHVSVYGGFAATETSRIQRKWMQNITVLSGDVGKDDTTSSDGIVVSPTHLVGNNSYHVVHNQGVSTTAVLDGFTITGGQANGTLQSRDHGGGVLNVDSSPTLQNLIVQGNIAGTFGGGIANLSNSAPLINNITAVQNSARNGGGIANAFNATATIQNSTITHNDATYSGGGIDNQSGCSVTVSDSIIANNTAPYGGGLHSRFCTLTMTNNYIAENSASLLGGGIFAGLTSTTTLKNSVIQLNQAMSGGGIIFRDSIATLQQVEVLSNTATMVGGGLYTLDNTTVEAQHINFIGNQADSGGAIRNLSTTNFTLQDSSIENNQARFGGAISSYASTTTVKTTDIHSNTATQHGGGIHAVYGNIANIDRVTVTQNIVGGNGGGIYQFQSELFITDTHIAENKAQDSGGGLHFSGAEATLYNVFIAENTAVNIGGGMTNIHGSSPQLDSVTFYSNTASVGGGMMNQQDGKPTLNKVQFFGNSANGGGGMANYFNAYATLNNVLFSGNQANQGGALNNVSAGSTLQNVTMGNNQATSGGGIYNSNATVAITNTIIWGNQATYDPAIINTTASTITIAYSNIEGSGGSAVWDPTIGSDSGGNIDRNPQFIDVDGMDSISGTIDDNFHLKFSSPSIDAGTNVMCSSQDLEGFPRPLDGDNDTINQCDMGAHEFIPFNRQVVLAGDDGTITYEFPAYYPYTLYYSSKPYSGYTQADVSGLHSHLNATSEPSYWQIRAPSGYIADAFAIFPFMLEPGQ